MSELKLFRRVAIDFKTRRVLFDLPRAARIAGPGRSRRLSADSILPLPRPRALPPERRWRTISRQR
jgi:hypothetical protein